LVFAHFAEVIPKRIGERQLWCAVSILMLVAMLPKLAGASGPRRKPFSKSSSRMASWYMQ
jgi:hypothetical protein